MNYYIPTTSGPSRCRLLFMIGLLSGFIITIVYQDTYGVRKYSSKIVAGTDSVQNENNQIDLVELRKLTLSERAKRMKEICSGLTNFTMSSHNSSNVFLSGMYVNNEKKTLFCRINKAGSMSARHYFAHLNNRMTVGEKFRYVSGFDHPKANYYFLVNMPLDESRKIFKDYTKIILVRHPLQRFASAYYEFVVKTRHGLGRHVHDLTQFVNDLVLLIPNPHWRDYQHMCHPCEMRYDYVVKLEAIDSDVAALSTLLGGNTSLTYPHGHVNRRFSDPAPTSSPYKYDDILRNWELLEPVAFAQVLDKYSTDMKMFGYTWNNGSGSCGDSTIDHC